MAIRAKGLDIAMQAPPGGVHSDEFRAISPTGKVPLLIVDEFKLPESEVICEYLEDRYPEKPLRSPNALERARGRLISRIVDNYVMEPLVPLFRQIDPATRDQSVVSGALANITKGLGWLDAVIAPGPYANGPMLSLADCTAVPTLYFVQRFGAMFGLTDAYRGHNISSYWRAVQEDKIAMEIIGAMEAQFKAYFG